MSIKISLLKTGEQLISEMKELVAEDQDQAESGWYNGEEDRFVYGKIYEDVVEDVGFRWVDVDDD